MSLYLCSTPYHLFLSLCLNAISNETSVLYLTSHDDLSIKNFSEYKDKLLTIDGVEKVVIRKRNLLYERLKFERIKDIIELNNIENNVLGKRVYIFPWNPYSLYSISDYIYKKSGNVTLVEDGANLYLYPRPNPLFLFVKKYILGVKTNFYRDSKIKEILVQYPERYPDHLKLKLKKLNMKEIFANLSSDNKKKIVSVFLTDKQTDFLTSLDTRKSVIILTQPLSEDGFCNEEEKKQIYADIINAHSNYNIILKKHPRERTSYKFKDVLELNGSFPSEIFSMLDMRFKKAVGVCTSAVNTMDAEEKVNTDEDFLKRRKKND